MEQNNFAQRAPLLDQQELQHLISVSTGLIDVFKVECFEQPDMLLPQNIVLSAQTCDSNLKSLEWHDISLPIYAVNNTALKEGVALIIEGETQEQRFALLCDEMPEVMRLRISEVVDDDRPVESKYIFQYVNMQETVYQVPALDVIYKDISK